MTSQEILDLAHARGLTIRAEEGNLFVSPIDRLDPELKDLLTAHKSALVELLSPKTLLDSPKSMLRRLEKELQDQALDGDASAIVIWHLDHPHDEEEVRRAVRTLWRQTGGGAYSWEVGGNRRCDICNGHPATSPTTAR